jgi:hypothetical protein
MRKALVVLVVGLVVACGGGAANQQAAGAKPVTWRARICAGRFGRFGSAGGSARDSDGFPPAHSLTSRMTNEPTPKARSSTS